VTTETNEQDRYIEAILGARLMIHYPLGSVKTADVARRCDRLTIRVWQLRRKAAASSQEG